MMRVLILIAGLAVCSESTAENASVEMLNKKCMVELRYQLVPTNCFRWLKASALRAPRKMYLREWFSSVCKKAMKKDESQVQFHVHHMSVLSEECRKDMETAFDQWSYKSKSENPERILQLMANGRARSAPESDGKDIEYRAGDETKKTQRPGNLGNPR